MTKYGQYETVREVFRGGLGGVWTARRLGGDGSDSYVVKTVRNSPDAAGAGANVAAEQFVAAARAQERAAGNKGAHWAPIHETSLSPEGAYYVTDQYLGSVQRLVMGRARVDGKTLRTITLAIVRGLRELKESANRAHGNLKPSNVLFSDRTNPTKGKIVLTDPLEPNRLDAVGSAVADTKAIGKIIYQLVMQEEFREMGGWPVAMSPQWLRLGKNGKQWHHLCNALLDPSTSNRPPNLEDLEARVKKMREGGGNVGGMLKIAAVLLFVVGLGAGGWFAYSQGMFDGNGGGGGGDSNLPAGWTEALYEYTEPYRDSDDFDKEAWATLWDVEDALADLSASLSQPLGEGTLADALRAIEPLTPAVEALETAIAVGLPLRARDVHPDIGSGNKRFGPAEAQVPESVWLTAATLDVARKVQSSVDAWDIDAAVGRAYEICQSEEWRRLGSALSGIQRLGQDDQDEADELKLASESLPLLILLQHEGTLQGFLDDWDRLSDEVADTLARTAEQLGADIEPFKSFRTQFERELEDIDANVTRSSLEDPAVLVAHLGKIRESMQAYEGVGQEMLAWLGGVWADEIDQGCVSGNYRAWPRDSVLSAESWQTWKTTVEGECIRDIEAADPRTLPENDFASIESDIRSKINRVVQTDTAEFAEIDRRFKALNQQRERLSISNLPWRHSNIDEIERGVGKWREDARDLEQDIDTIIEGQAQEQRELYNQIVSINNLVPGSAAINAEWRRRRDIIDGGHGSLDEMYEGVSSTQAYLRDLEAEFAEGIVGGGSGGDSGVVEAVIALIATRREAAIGRAIQDLQGEAELTDASDDLWSDERDAWESERKQLSDVIKDVTLARALLREGYGLTDTRAQGEADLQTLSERWSDAASDPNVRRAMADVLGGVAALASLETANQNALKQEALSSDTLSVRLVSWQRLGEQRDWPRRSAEGLREELAIREGISQSIAGLPDSRRADITRELSDEAIARWSRVAQAMTTYSEFGPVAELADDFGITPDDLTGTLALRAYVWEFSQRIQTGEVGDEAAAQQLAQALVTSVSDLEDGVSTSQWESVEDWLSDIQSIASGEQDYTPIAPENWGPMKANAPGWEAKPALENGNLVYTLTGGDNPNRPLVIDVEFVRVEPDPEAGVPEAVYISRDEVSIGLFMEVFAQAGKVDQMWGFFPPDSVTYWRGPRGWKKGGRRRGMVANGTWIQDSPGLTAQNRYPAGASPDPATLEHPMHHLPVAAALACATEVGCRLPMSSELSAIISMELAGMDTEGYIEQTRANVRDATWESQRQFMLANEGQLNWPDAAAFYGPNQAAAPPEGANARPWTNSDDDYLWFAPTTDRRGTMFSHLIGNVWELYFDDPASLVGGVGDYQSFIAGRLGEIGVLGGSALADKSLGILQPHNLPATLANNGFSDVGFRLAFSARGTQAPNLDLTQRLANAARNAPYLSDLR